MFPTSESIFEMLQPLQLATQRAIRANLHLTRLVHFEKIYMSLHSHRLNLHLTTLLQFV
jgi:hypothetical protein